MKRKTATKMGLSHFRVTGTLFLLYLCGTCLCTTTVKYYRLDSLATRVVSAGLKSLSSVSRGRCFAECNGILTCYYVSYEDVQGGCILSSWNDTSISVDGWSLYRLDLLGPDIGDYVDIGNYSIALSSQHMTKPEAEDACASFGYGRLVEIRTTQMYEAIHSYLMSLSSDMQTLYGSLWVASEWDGVANDYVFSDGSSLALTPSNTNDANGDAKCIRLTLAPFHMYKFDDRGCSHTFSYMCERLL